MTSLQCVLLTSMALIVSMIASARTRLNVIPKRGLANAQTVGQEHIVISRVCWGHLARTVFTIVLVNPSMLRGLAISKLGNVFAIPVTQEISMLMTMDSM